MHTNVHVYRYTHAKPYKSFTEYECAGLFVKFCYRIGKYNSLALPLICCEISCWTPILMT